MHAHDETSITCERAYDLLFDYLEGNLRAEDAQAVREHMAACPPCLEFLSSYEKTPGVCRKALAREVPPEVTDQVKAFLRKKLGGR